MTIYSAGWRGTGGQIESPDVSDAILTKIAQNGKETTWETVIRSNTLDNAFSLCISNDGSKIYICGITNGELSKVP